jgi:hypothetical protein
MVANPIFEGFPAMAKQPAEQIAEATTEALAKSGEAAEKIVKGNAEALTESGNASRAAVQELTRAYQELATKNALNRHHLALNRHHLSYFPPAPPGRGILAEPPLLTLS